MPKLITVTIALSLIGCDAIGRPQVTERMRRYCTFYTDAEIVQQRDAMEYARRIGYDKETALSGMVTQCWPDLAGDQGNDGVFDPFAATQQDDAIVLACGQCGVAIADAVYGGFFQLGPDDHP